MDLLLRKHLNAVPHSVDSTIVFSVQRHARGERERERERERDECMIARMKELENIA